MKAKSNSLLHRLGRAFLLQAAVISIVAVLSVFAAGFTLQEIMIKQALRQEAEHFWARYEDNPKFALPATQNLTGYLRALDASDSDTATEQPKPFPDYLSALNPGFHSLHSALSGNVEIYVSDRAQQRLYLVFNNEQVSELATYFGLVPLAGILIVLYLGAWLAYRMSRRAISPIIWLAEEVNRLDPRAPDSQAFAPERLPGDGHNELWVLASAIKSFAERLNAFVERERNFTRDASHELRSPLTVIKMATELLNAEASLSPQARQATERIKRCANEMEELINMFLLLARETEQGIQHDTVLINDIVEQELNQAKLLAGDKPITVSKEAHCRLFVKGPSKVLSVLIGNLIRNAFSYTDAGHVLVRIESHSLLIEDSGIGIEPQQVKDLFRPYFRADQRQRGGHGVGLTIVKRLSDRFHWPVQIDSQVGKGTRVLVEFPDSNSR